MIFAVLFFVCGIIQIKGRPGITPSIMDNVSSSDEGIKISPWPLPKNTFLLPNKLSHDDIINVTVIIRDTPILTISLMKSTGVLCTLVANTKERIVKILNENGAEIAVQDLENFYHEGNESMLNVWFKRRLNAVTQDDNVIEINSKTDYQVFEFNDVDSVTHLSFSGENVMVSDLQFKFAVK